ncbi:MAG: RNA methyltransferase [Firmicutes bacterium]|nr:RNA methyltransferase [Bacillota bacterium]
MKITSLQNKQIVDINKLHQKKYRDIENKFLVEGDHLIKEATKANKIISTIGLDDSYDLEVTKEVLDKLSSQASGTNEIAVVEKLDERKINGNVVILDNIQDPGNLGTIIRSAVAFNIDTLILSDNSVDLYNDKVIRSSEGMIFHLNILRRKLKDVILDLKENGYKIYATTVNGNGDFENDDKIALVIGNEGNGISDEILKLCDKNITIKMNNLCESLNAGVCASILMYKMGDIK